MSIITNFWRCVYSFHQSNFLSLWSVDVARPLYNHTSCTNLLRIPYLYNQFVFCIELQVFISRDINLISSLFHVNSFHLVFMWFFSVVCSSSCFPLLFICSLSWFSFLAGYFLRPGSVLVLKFPRTFKRGYL